VTSIDINCDMGESFGCWTLGRDAEVMPHISSANVACGGHAGDPNVMAATVLLAKQHGVAVGAHPGYPDLAGFGRRHLPMTHEEVRAMMLAQIGALYAIARSYDYDINHVSPMVRFTTRLCATSGLPTQWSKVSGHSPGRCQCTAFRIRKSSGPPLRQAWARSVRDLLIALMNQMAH
jgi:hypothetical protein